MLCALVHLGERERSLALLCTVSITARARERGSDFARSMEKRRRIIIVAAAAHAQRTTHPLLKVARGMTQIRAGEGEREGERERGIYKPRAVAAWAMLLGCRRNGGEDEDAQML